MELNNDKNLNEKNDHSMENNTGKPKSQHINNENNLTQKDLEVSFFSAREQKPVMEGKGMGGQKFGQNNLTPSGNDKNNPSQYAGHSNAYFNRTEPSEEHPEDTNFKVRWQDGMPDYDKAQPQSAALNQNDPKPEKIERGNGEIDRPHEEEKYEEGTADNDGQNIPGPEELPDQQKVGENIDEETYRKDHQNSAN